MKSGGIINQFESNVCPFCDVHNGHAAEQHPGRNAEASPWNPLGNPYVYNSLQKLRQ